MTMNERMVQEVCARLQDKSVWKRTKEASLKATPGSGVVVDVVPAGNDFYNFVIEVGGIPHYDEPAKFITPDAALAGAVERVRQILSVIPDADHPDAKSDL